MGRSFKRNSCNILFLSVAVFCGLVMLSELILACRGHFLVDKNYYMKSLLLYLNQDEVDFIINKTGWGSSPGRDGEDPRVKKVIWSNGMRECRADINKTSQFNVAFVGCSYTFGTGVEAKDTMVWLLNDRYADVAFDNYGCSGYGPLQMYARVEKLLNQDDNYYDLIVCNTVGDHMTRNYKPRAVGNTAVGTMYTPVPYAEFDIWGKYRMYFVEDLRWPAEDCLLTSDFLKRCFYAYRTRIFEEKYDVGRGVRPEPELYAECLNRMHGLCLQNGVDFVVCDLNECRDAESKLVYSLLNNPYIRCEIVDLDMPGDEFSKPYNRVLNNPKLHPNKNVHRYWAGEFSKWFDKRYAEYAK